jgi:ferredoxin
VTPRDGPRESLRLRVDPVACDGIGLCAFLAANAVELDRWGYPIVVERDLEPDEVRGANRAVKACPRRALFLDRVPAPAPAHPAWHPTSAA